METFNFGPMNGHVVGMTLKEIVRRVMAKVHELRIHPEITQKTVAYKTDPADIVTAADFAAQELFVTKIKECFPGYGIIAEEHDLVIPCTLKGMKAYFTIDGVDGTKALARQQSHGIGTMLSLTVNDEIVAAFVGDIMTGELYYYRPGSDKVHRLNWRDERYLPLQGIISQEPLNKRYLLLREHPASYSKKLWPMLAEAKHDGCFKSIEVSGGSIGIWMARLWKNEVGAGILAPCNNTPWDLNPVAGISMKLGFLFLTLNPISGKWAIGSRGTAPIRTFEEWATETLVIHKEHLTELASYGMLE